MSLTADVVAYFLELGIFDCHCAVGVLKDLVRSAEGLSGFVWVREEKTAVHVYMVSSIGERTYLALLLFSLPCSKTLKFQSEVGDVDFEQQEKCTTNERPETLET